MKKFIFAFYVAALVLMIPAIFIGYLYTDNNSVSNAKSASKMKGVLVQPVNTTQETSFKPGVVFTIKGV